MLIVHVHVHVKPECVGAFRQATIDNATQSVQEPGIVRFDVVQQADGLPYRPGSGAAQGDGTLRCVA
jgi:quinol monooxygenase YgiN